MVPKVPTEDGDVVFLSVVTVQTIFIFITSGFENLLKNLSQPKVQDQDKVPADSECSLLVFGT